MKNMLIHRSVTSETGSHLDNKQGAVLGIGNPLLGDEGVGVHIVENFKKKYYFSPKIALINGGCGGLNLYFILERYDPVIIIDALAPNTGVPGSTHIINRDLLKGQIKGGCSAHSVGIKDALMLLQSLTKPPEDLVLIGIVPAVLEYNFGLSSIIEQQLPLVHSRLYKGGRIGGVWFVFRKNALSGIFHITGYGIDCVFVLNKGKVVKFSVKDQLKTWNGDEALSRLKLLVRKSDVRFSVFVTP